MTLSRRIEIDLHDALALGAALGHAQRFCAAQAAKKTAEDNDRAAAIWDAMADSYEALEQRLGERLRDAIARPTDVALDDVAAYRTENVLPFPGARHAG